MTYLDYSQLIFSETLILRGEQVVTSVEKKSWGKQRIIKPPKFFETWLVYLVLPGWTHRTLAQIKSTRQTNILPWHTLDNK